jgi:hypothetical protein
MDDEPNEQLVAMAMHNSLTDAEKAAWAAGRNEAIEEAADIAEHRHEYWSTVKGHGVCCDVTACEEIARAILALKDK